MIEPAISPSTPRRGELLDGGGRRRKRQRVRVHRRTEVSGPVRIGLWLPLTPLWVLLAPFALLLAPLLSLSRRTRGVNPFRAVLSIGAVLFALSGTDVAVTAPGARIRIRIF
ncbi:MAG TPA: hypothetical protein VME40_17930 [Caulobacteraceae bacterium]|nr:hypothetical protein [Caulobacteraceae bacterium]